MSRSIRNVIKKRHKPYTIQKFDRGGGYVDQTDGLWVDDPESRDTVLLHLQPIVDKLDDGVPGQRQLISWHGWAVEGQEVSNKDVVLIPDGSIIGKFTVSNMVPWPGEYREFDLTRSGEAENIDT